MQRSVRNLLQMGVGLFLLHGVGLWAMARFRVMELLLAGGGDFWKVWLAGCFLIMRFLLFFAVPGILLAATWMWFRRQAPEKP